MTTKLPGGVVHEDVDPPELVYRRGDEGVHLLGVANVGRLPECLPALALDQVDGLVQRLRAPSRDDDPSPEAREFEREGAAEAAAPASDERDLPFEGSLSEHRRHSPRFSAGIESKRYVGGTSSGLISISARSGRDAARRESAATASAAARHVHGRSSPRAGQDRRAAERADELLGLRRVDGSERHRGVVQQLRVDAAEADEDDRAEARIPESSPR